MKKKQTFLAILLTAVLTFVWTAASVYGYLEYHQEEGEAFTPASTPAYQETLFDTGELAVIEIDISDADFAEITDNAYAENYVSCDITINGENVTNVGIRAKGNGSLLMTSLAGTDRHGYKIEFDHYVEGQTYEGLDKLILNNGLSDPSFMKEAIAYDMFRYMGVASSLCNYAQVMVNGQYLGLYLALEGVEDAFLERNYGEEAGELYKPDSESVQKIGEQLGLEDASAAGQSTYDLSDLYRGWDYETFLEQQANAMDFSGMTDSATIQAAIAGNDDTEDADDDAPDPVTALRYVGDDLSDYSLIWDSSVTETDDEDHQRVLDAITYISKHAGGSLDSVMDVDAMLRYMAVHTFVVNLDSIYSGSNHNYYLYEKDGKICMLPWDYNESMGGFALTTADEFVNFPIDSPYFNVDIENEAFFEAILSNRSYRKQYHAYLQQLAEEYVQGGRLEALYEGVRGEIDGAVEEDPTAFYVYSMYDTYASDQIELLQLRAESVLRQIEDGEDAEPVSVPEDLHYYGRTDSLLDKISLAMSAMFGGDTRIGHIMVHLKEMTYEEYREWSRSQIYSYVQVPADYYADAVWTGDWCEIEAGGQTLMQFGCGLCCLTNTYDTLIAGRDRSAVITPDVTYELARQNASYKPESGVGALSWQQMWTMCRYWGLQAGMCRKPADYATFETQIARADTVIALVCSTNDDSLWPTTQGHYISLWDYDAATDTVYVTDSSGLHNRQRVALEDIYRALKTSSKYQYLLIDQE